MIGGTSHVFPTSDHISGIPSTTMIQVTQPSLTFTRSIMSEMFVICDYIWYIHRIRKKNN